MMVMMLKETGPQAWVMLALLALATLVGLGAFIGWALNRRVPAGIPVLAFASVAFVPVVFGGPITHIGMNAAANASAEMKMQLIASSISMALGGRWLMALVLMLPVLVFILAAGIVGAIRGPRRVAPPVLVVLCGLGAAMASAVGALQQNPVAFALGPVYVLASLAIAAGLTSAVDTKHPTAGPQAAAAAAMAFPLLVFLGETWVVHDGYMMSFMAVANASAEMKTKMLESGLAWAEMRSWARAIAMALSAVVACIGAISALDDRPGANAATLVGLVTIVVGVLFSWSPARALFDMMMAVWS